MTDPFEIEAASGGGGDYIPKDKYEAWGEHGVACLCRIRQIDPKGSMLPGFSNPCDPVTVDLLVMTEPPVVYRAEQMTNAGMTNKLRTREVNVNGKPLTVDRAPGQLVAGHFHRYKDRFGTMRTGINPATDAELEMFRTLAGQHGDLFEHFDRLQLQRAAAAVNGAGNGHQVADPQTSGAVVGDVKLPF